MDQDEREMDNQDLSVTRRLFLQASSLGLAASASLLAQAQLRVEVTTQQNAMPDYLTRQGDFGTVERGNPPPYLLPEPRLREIGMTRETWKLEVVPDASTGSKVENPMTRERGTALDWAGFMKLAEKRAVRFLKVITCNNLNSPLGMGLWEGVPLRDVVWMCRPVSEIRRVFYYGHHHEDPKQMFRSSLSLSRVLEDPPGDNPVILAYKLNGALLSGKRGGPVRVIVPEAYGFKSVKWLQRIVLTNLAGANDTYADDNNDVDSWMKSVARFLTFPEATRPGTVIPVSGVAQVGVSGLSKVQYWLTAQGTPLPAGDPYFANAPWRDAALLPAPVKWGGGLPGDRIPSGTIGFSSETDRPKAWPVRYAIAHWAATIPGVPAGIYDLRCRAIDANGIAQPLPRPLPRSGMNAIETVSINVKRA